jgi:nucleotide-binding universal stress UspA family protein
MPRRVESTPRIGKKAGMRRRCTMKGFKKILFPIDFSECSKKVFPFALDIAKKFDAKLHLLFVARDISYLTITSAGGDMLRSTIAEVARAGKKTMREFCDKELSDFSNYETEATIGGPAKMISKFASERDIDLIVMGTHGRKGLDRTLMGSVADHVIKNADVPVLTINPFRPKVKYVKT